jgi:hypothetical protein
MDVEDLRVKRNLENEQLAHRHQLQMFNVESISGNIALKNVRLNHRGQLAQMDIENLRAKLKLGKELRTARNSLEHGYDLEMNRIGCELDCLPASMKIAMTQAAEMEMVTHRLYEVLYKGGHVSLDPAKRFLIDTNVKEWEKTHLKGY